MRIGVIAANAMERAVLALGLAPVPLLDTQMAFTMARAIMAGVELGVFEALARDELMASEVASRGALDERATDALLRALVGCGYLTYQPSSRRYGLRPVARRWLLRDSAHTIANKLRFQSIEWDMVGRLEQFVRSGAPLELHRDDGSPERWRAYQLAMSDLGRLALPEVSRRTPIPKGATDMIDIGGSGGTYAAAFLRARPAMRGTILDLPAAAEHARPLVEALGLGDRLKLVAGDVLDADLGQSRFDFAFMGNVAHHLTDAQNEAVARKVHAALRRGGTFAILESERTPRPGLHNQFGALLDLYFAMTSRSGTWSVAEMSTWLRSAGYAVGKPIRFRTAPGIVQVWGRRK